MTIVDPSERISALVAFLDKNGESDLALTAREEIVRSRAELGEQKLKENNIEGALALFRQAVAELPEKISDQFYESAVARLSVAISARGYRAEAITIARLLEARFAKEPLRLGGLGELYLNLEAPDDAIRALEAGVRLAREDVRLRRPLAAAYRMALRLDEAEKELQQVAALDPNDKRAYTELGHLARARGDYEEATRLYRSQLRTDENNSSALKGLALVQLAMGRDTDAAASLDQIRKLKGAEEVDADLQLQTQLGFYFLAQKKYPQANLAIVQAIAREPRYSWARLAAAELDLAEGRYFEAEKHLIAGLRNADFPTLRFTLGKLYLAVDDFNGAIEQFNRAFTLSRSGKFAAHLGGILDLESERVSDLLARERQAAIFVAKPPTTAEQFTLAETIVRLDARLQALKTGAETAPTTRRPTGGRINARASSADSELEQAATAFIEAEGQRRAFRALYVAQRLAQMGKAPALTQKLTEQVLGLAETATAAEGSLLEYPNYDREGRLKILRGRALDARGWSLFQQQRHREAITVLSEAANAYGDLPEGKLVQWRLATVKETVGEEREALNLYLAAYEQPEDSAVTDVKRTVIEVLYRKLNGSLNGLDEKIGKPLASAVTVSTDKAPAEESVKTAENSAGRSGRRVETKSEPPPVSAEKAAPRIIKLPEVAGKGPELALGRVNINIRSARSLLITSSTPPRPGERTRPQSAELLEIVMKDDLPLATPRVNTRLLRWPFKAEAENAPPPSTIEVAREKPETPGGRPRRVLADETPEKKEDKKEEPPAPTRSRRVRTP